YKRIRKTILVFWLRKITEPLHDQSLPKINVVVLIDCQSKVLSLRRHVVFRSNSLANCLQSTYKVDLILLGRTNCIQRACCLLTSNYFEVNLE
ncbi:uncharacterized protein ACHE_10565S, partial [Aspergillus chevalieri]